jgi:hypothetical protein
MMAKFGAIYLSCQQHKKVIEEVESVASILVENGYLFTVRYHYESPWIQLYAEEPENVVQYAQEVSNLFLDKKVLGLAAYTVSDSVSFCLFETGKVKRLLQSGFNEERKWEMIAGEVQWWEPEILENITMEIGSLGMVSYHIQRIGVLLNLPGFGIPASGEPWSKEIIH